MSSKDPIINPTRTCSKSTMEIQLRYVKSSKVTTETPERHQWRCVDIFIVNFKQFSLVFRPRTIKWRLQTYKSLFENGITDLLKVHCVRSVRMQQNTDQNNSEYGQFLRSGRKRIQFDYLQQYS